MTRAAMMTWSIGPTDRIEILGGRWDEFATENGASSLNRRATLGTLLWDHLTGAEAIELHREIVRAARDGASPTVPFRCDAPGMRRYMELSAVGDGSWVHFTSRLLREEPRPVVGFPLSAMDREMEICTQCRRLRTSEGWREIEKAIPHLGLHGSHEPRKLVESVCSECSKAVAELIAV